MKFHQQCLDNRHQWGHGDPMKADAVTPSVDLPPDGDGHPSHPEHPAVLPRLTYTISDLWAGRISEAVREQWDALCDCLDQDHEPQVEVKTTYNKIYDRPAPDIQQVIADQLRVDQMRYDTDQQDPPSGKKPTWGRLMTRGR